MAKNSELIVRIAGDATKYEDELKKVKDQTADLEKQLGKVAKISGTAFAAGAASIGVATASAAKFESKFTNVITLLDEGSFKTKTLEQGIDGLRGGVLALGQQTGESFDALNSALFDLISSGVDAGDAVDTLEVATKLASAGATDTATAVQALTATLTAFGDKAGDAQAISEKFFTAQKFGVTTVGDLAKEFNKVAGLANNLGVSFDEALASLSSLTADGAKPTAEAATQLKAALNGIINVQQNLGKESEAVQKALSLQNLEQKGLVGALNDLKVATGGSIEEQKRLLGSSEALQAVLSLTGAQAELVQKQVTAMGDAQQRAATFAEALATKQDTTQKAVARFSRAVETAAILIGEQFAPFISKAADILTSFFQVFNESPILAKTTALILGIGTAASGIVAGLAVAAQAFLGLRAAMIALNISTRATGIAVKSLVGATGIGLLVIVAAEVLARWETIWPAVTDAFVDFANMVLPTVQKVTNFFIESFNSIAGGAIKFGKAYIAVWRGIINTVTNLLGGFGEILSGVFTLDIEKIKNGVKRSKDALVNGVKDTFNEVKEIVDEENENLIAPIKLEPFEKSEAQKAVDESLEGVEGKVKVGVETSGADSGQSDDALAKLKENEAKKTKILTDEEKKRIKANQERIALIKAQEEGASEEQLDFIRRKNELIEAEQAAQQIKNDEVRASELELIRAQNEQLLEEQAEYNEQLKEQQAEQREQQAALDEELKALSDEERNALNEQELETLRGQVATKRQIEANFQKERLEQNVKARNQFLKDERQFGTAFATFNQTLRNEDVQNAERAAGQLVQLQQSKNSTLKGIGKAAALAQVAINTPRGALDAYSSLAGIPIVGPALGATAAAALIAFGAEQAGQILAANQGGIVPTSLGIPGRDSVPSLLTPGELVVPQQNFDEVVSSVASSRSGGNDSSTSQAASSTQTINNNYTINGDILADETFIDTLIDQINDRVEDGNASLTATEVIS